MKGKHLTNETKKKLSDILKIRCNNIEERHRLREIGRKGGFGKKDIRKIIINMIHY